MRAAAETRGWPRRHAALQHYYEELCSVLGRKFLQRAAHTAGFEVPKGKAFPLDAMADRGSHLCIQQRDRLRS